MDFENLFPTIGGLKFEFLPSARKLRIDVVIWIKSVFDTKTWPRIWWGQLSWIDFHRHWTELENRLPRWGWGTLAIVVPILQVLAPLWCSPLAAIHDDEDAAASKDEEAAGAGKIEPPKMFSYCFIILLLLDHTESYPNLKDQYVELWQKCLKWPQNDVNSKDAHWRHKSIKDHWPH